MKEVGEYKWRQLWQKSFVTYGLLLIQFILLLWMEVVGFGLGGSENLGVLVRFGAMERGHILLQHEYWRFVTPMFLHIGWAHFAINGVTLYFIGQQVEAIYGHGRFFLLYLLSGIAGNIASFALGQANSISAGASTSLFGLFGAFIVLGHLFKDNPAIKVLVQRYWVFIGMNLIFNLFSSNIDMMGHIGGFIGGILASLAISIPKKMKKTNPYERITSGLLFLFLAVILVIYGFKKYGFTL